jgi:chromosome segregation ATPase
MTYEWQRNAEEVLQLGTEKLREATNQINKASEAIKQLSAERDELKTMYNHLARAMLKSTEELEKVKNQLTNSQARVSNVENDLMVARLINDKLEGDSKLLATELEESRKRAKALESVIWQIDEEYSIADHFTDEFDDVLYPDDALESEVEG